MIETLNKNHFKINSDHLAIIKIDNDTKKAKFDYFPIEEHDNAQIRELKKEVLLLSKLTVGQKKNNNQGYDDIENKLVELQRFILEDDVFARFRRRFNYCQKNQTVLFEGSNEEYIQTCYFRPFEGLDPFEACNLNVIDEELAKDLAIYEQYLDAQSAYERTKIFEPLKYKYPINKKLVEIQSLQEPIRKDYVIKCVESFCNSVLKRISLLEFERSVGKTALDEQIKAYSTKEVGWKTFTFEIGEEYNAVINSNFGYGNSSYFCLTVEFRGVQLTPYSKYVKYYYADCSEMIDYTVQGYLYDSEWGRIFEYVVESYNLALLSVDKFITKYFIEELKTMVTKLEEWFNLSKDDKIVELQDVEVYNGGFEKKSKASIKTNTIDFEYFQLKKISGALEFIESIQKIKKVTSVQMYIDRILSLNKQMYPVGMQRIEILTQQIQKANEEKKAHEKERDRLQGIIDSILAKRVEVIKDGYYSLSDLEEIYSKGQKSYSASLFKKELKDIDEGTLTKIAELIEEEISEEFKKLEKFVSDERNTIYQLQSLISNLESWKWKFTHGVNVIEKYINEHLEI